jgi:uncharacterized membrane protein
MDLRRWLSHLTSSVRRTRALFSATVLGDIEAAIGAAEASHAGEIRFVIETSLPWPLLWRGISARQRAIELFARFHVWDTAGNNGVLIYVLRADRAVEIIADRGIKARVDKQAWEAVCRQVEEHYRASRYVEGSRAAVAGVARLLVEHFPTTRGPDNELPNQPILI